MTAAPTEERIDEITALALESIRVGKLVDRAHVLCGFAYAREPSLINLMSQCHRILSAQREELSERLAAEYVRR